ncbi:hypothetical protein [Nannocystis punicea]|uniref:Lipoprotein n=1 Tax=Nannocystis punicea TaxID=2995304 RepID=A0ABY7H9U5_9BACT|nr:hypothetical protein [Nannocystis poenicansa]WAS96043.1 hypothetical protein O0S08_07750 [Nannocystis poenicansa]
MPAFDLRSARTRRRAAVLALGAWLGVAPSMAGCYTMSVNPPRDAESKRALRVLKRHLRASWPGTKFYLKQLRVSAPGWTVFAGEQQDVRHGSLRYWVVRADASVVTGEPLVELSRAYRSLEAVRPDPSASPEDLSWIAVALLSRDQQLLDQRSYHGLSQHLNELYDGDDVAPPKLVRRGDAATLVFWVTVGHGLGVSRYELQISADYEVTVSVTSPQPHPGTR